MLSPGNLNRRQSSERPKEIMDFERYNARETEPKWREKWERSATFKTDNDDTRPKY